MHPNRNTNPKRRSVSRRPRILHLSDNEIINGPRPRPTTAEIRRTQLGLSFAGGYGFLGTGPTGHCLRRGNFCRMYPNYLPQLKARRAEALARSRTANQPSSLPSALLSPDAISSTSQAIVESQVAAVFPVTRRRNTFNGNPVRPNDAPLYIPSDDITRRYPKALISLYRTPSALLDQWDIPSPANSAPVFDRELNRATSAGAIGGSHPPLNRTMFRTFLPTNAARPKLGRIPNLNILNADRFENESELPERVQIQEQTAHTSRQPPIQPHNHRFGPSGPSWLRGLSVEQPMSHAQASASFRRLTENLSAHPLPMEEPSDTVRISSKRRPGSAAKSLGSDKPKKRSPSIDQRLSRGLPSMGVTITPKKRRTSRTKSAGSNKTSSSKK